MAIIHTSIGISLTVPEITKINSVGIFFEQKHEIEIEGEQLTSKMTVYVGSFVAEIKSVSSDGTSATILTPEIPNTPNMNQIEVYARENGLRRPGVMLKINNRPPSFGSFGNTGNDSFTTTVVAENRNEPEVDLGLIGEASQQGSSASQVLGKVFLNTPEGTVDDLSKEDEKREYAVEQISKYLRVTDNIESKVIKNHVTEAYIYDYENRDPNIEKSSKTSFYVRKFEEALESRDLLELPFYYLENINTVPHFKALSTISTPVDPSTSASITEETKRNNFFRDWKFSQKLKKQVFFSDIYEPNKLEHFPRSVSLRFELEPAISFGINNKVGKDDGISEAQYDNFCLKYISERTDEANGKVALISNNEEFDTQNVTVYPVERLYAGADEEKEYNDMTMVNNQAGWSEESLPPEWQTAYTKEIHEEDKDKLEEIFEEINSQNLMRTYRDIITGVPAKSEPFLYELIKYDADFRKICTFYFPARHYHSQGASAVLEFNDTQILQGIDYKYTLVSHRIVYGESYKFIEQEIEHALLSAEVDIGKRYEVEVEKDYVVMPIELSTLTVSSISSPGLPPEVKTIPQKNKGGMPKFFLSSRFGKNSFKNHESLYVPLTQEEVNNATSISESYIENGILEAHSRFPSKYFEVYRRDSAPLSISDFANTRIAQVSPSCDDSITYGIGATFEDSIEKNKKYYYLFRTVDAFGTPGVPLGPFEYEIVHDGSSYFVNFKAYDMTSSAPPSQNASFRRMLKISPHPRELSIPIDDEMQEMPSANHRPFPTMSISQYLHSKMREESKFWNKKYKIRIVSKKTGRKIDITFKPNLTSS